ncbi:hypothetical protein A1O1_06367 [Capronia coronata CBS 617.96]|uniref:Uncharacterized protein n=1 Tax=Capronia coronata CBS 617.96 TaxID=1182541 RepID=W9Y0J8_9EURO|nr:uncharacterized protein A1O1_06367 [Capronia coronata CBS 617.96]EXJ85998.1 hypothetical protein A1O1_06367 [Capronia coronata CBS 617.96]
MVTVNKLHEQDHNRRSVVEHFVRDLRRDLDIRAGYDKPRHVPFLEVGFSDQVIKRLRAHAKHTCSNYVMNLFHAATERRFPGTFELHQHVLYLCSDPAETWLGEIAFTQLCKGYITEGSGFSHHGAGFSHGSSYWSRTEQELNMLFLYKDADGSIQRRLKEDGELARKLDFGRPGAQEELVGKVEKDIEGMEAVLKMVETIKEIQELDSEKTENATPEN